MREGRPRTKGGPRLPRRACPRVASAHAAHASGERGRLARRQRSRSERQPAPAAVHHKFARSPVLAPDPFAPRTDSAAPPSARPREPQRHPWPTLRRIPNLPRSMHAVRTRVPSARLVACACSALRLSAASAPDQRPWCCASDLCGASLTGVYCDTE